MTLHMSIPFETFRRNPQDKTGYYAAVFRSFDELESFAKNAGVRIAMENLFLVPFKEEDEKFERLFERYDADYMGLCYDSGHATISGIDNYYHYLEKYNDRLFMTHLQDTDSIDPALLGDFSKVVAHDAHRPPFTGVLDWDRIARGVAKAPLMRFPADIEVVSRNIAESEEAAWLRDCLAKAGKFHEMVEHYKRQ
jgi:sugar phosphate isomerase/epimerase